MLDTEAQWKKANRQNIIMGAVGLCVLIAAGPLSRLLNLDLTLIRSMAAGVVASAVLLWLWLFRKPKTRPTGDEIEQMEKRYTPLMLLSPAATFLGLLGLVILQNITLADPTYIAAHIAMFTLILIGGVLSLPLLKMARISRVEPSLNDERMQRNMNSSYQTAFLTMFNLCLLSGVAFTFDVIEFDAGTALFAIGAIGIFTQCFKLAWLEWKDAA